MTISKNQAQVHDAILRLMRKVEKPATKGIPYPYLAITENEDIYGETLYVWDAFHAALRFAHEGNAAYLRHLVDAVLHYQGDDGYAPNRVHKRGGPVGSTPKWHAQPFLVQAALLYVERARDTDWAQGVFPRLERYVGYYEKHRRAPNGLFTWPLSYIGGLDNDIVTTFHLPGSVISCDLSAWLYLEYRAAARLTALLGRSVEAETWQAKAGGLRDRINQILWNEETESYRAWHLLKGRPLTEPAFQTSSNLIPLHAGIASDAQARAMLRRYVFSEDHFLSPFGIRSLSKSSPYYNNAVWGNPPRFGDYNRATNSNWQGPVWVLLAYFMVNACLNYGFTAEAQDLCERTFRVLAQSLETQGSFAENFHAETGAPLYVKGFASWNLLADILPDFVTHPAKRPMATIIADVD